LELVGRGLIVFLEFMEIFAVFHQVGALDGLAFCEVLVIFGLASTAFALAVGQMGRVSERIRAGTFDLLWCCSPLRGRRQAPTDPSSHRRHTSHSGPAAPTPS
jgi:ABC-type uncharacterized transport system permease subunit